MLVVAFAIMVTPEFLEYIRQQLAAGFSKDVITKTLADNGWQAVDIQGAFIQLTEARPIVARVPPPAFPVRTEIQPLHEEIHETVVSIVAPLSHHVIWMIVAMVFLIGIGGGAVYAYVQKIGPFAHTPYTETNLISGLLVAASGITSSSYGMSAALAVVPREVDALPFTVQVGNEVELANQYKNDSVRAQNITGLLYFLQSQKNGYAPTLKQLLASPETRNSYMYKDLSVNDPVSGQPYAYAVTESGKNFALKVTFETSGAIATLHKSYGFVATTTPISGQTVTFTKDSPTNLYLSSEPPKPFLVQLGEMMRFLPAEITASFSITAASDWSKAGQADWKFNVDATGDLGDLSYKVNADAVKKDTNYYFRINNIPSLFGEALSSVKGQWVKIDSSASSATSSDMSGNEFQFVATQLPEVEKSYKENKTQMVESLKTLSTFADEVRLFSFKNAPHSEQVDGRLLYRYDLSLNKDAILPFYKKTAEEANTNVSIKQLGIFDDPGMIEYLQGSEFSQVFDYYNKNTSLTLWVDPQGFPAQLEYTMRVVPPDTATQLAKKQVTLTWKLALSNINQPVDITVPANAKPIQALIGDLSKNISYSLGDARTRGNDAAVQSDLATLQTQAEIYYGSHKSYGTQAWVSGAATSCAGGMFKDTTINKALVGADTANGAGKNVACYAGGTQYVVGTDLVSSGWWCVDSTGSAKTETGTVPSVLSKNKVCP